MIYKFHPNFEEEANIKNKDSIIAIELNDLSLIFFLIIYCFTFTLFIFILEILIFRIKIHKLSNYPKIPSKRRHHVIIFK